MNHTKPEVELHFSHPIRQVIMMLTVVGLTGFGVVVAAPRVLPVFTANIWLNGIILFVFLIGVVSCFAQVMQLIKSVRWIENFASEKSPTNSHTPQLLAPLATLLRSRGARMQIPATSTRSILDSVSTRIEEAREITRYIVNVLIFLGLLGTFYGLATTVPALVETIRSLAPQDGETGFEVFNRLMSGLEGQLGGMGVAFASSLLGLAGSLVVGLLELFAGHGQNRFYRELEEWLSSITRLGMSSGDFEGGAETSVLISVIDQLAEQMETMQMMLTQSDVNRTVFDEKLDLLNATLLKIAEQSQPMHTGNAIDKLLQSQQELVNTMTNSGMAEAGIDAESRMRLRSMDVQMLHLSEEIASGRQESISALRTEFAKLTDAILQGPSSNPTKKGS